MAPAQAGLKVIPEPMKAKFVVVDPGLSRLGGHNYTLAMTFSDAAHAMGYEVLWLCHKTLPSHLVPDHVRVERVFSPSYYKKFQLRWYGIRLLNWILDRTGPTRAPWAMRLSLRIYPYAREMAAALRRLGIGPNDHVFVTTAEYLQYEALLQVFLTEPPKALPFFHVRTSFDEHVAMNRRFGDRLPGMFRRFQELGVVGKRVFFYAETPDLAEHFRDWGIVPFDVLENPLPSNLLASSLVSEENDSDRPLIITFPGQARSEKGYLRLPRIVAALQARGGVSRPYRFVLQSNLRKAGKKERARRKDLDRTAAKKALQSVPGDIVRLVDKPLSNDEYYALIADADVVLLPYDAERYRNRPSMIASEAALFGKPMVVTAGTTLAAFAGPDLGETASTDEEFADRLAVIINDYEAYRAKAAARAETLRRDLDGRTLIRRMIGRAEAKGDNTANIVTGQPSNMEARNARARNTECSRIR